MSTYAYLEIRLRLFTAFSLLDAAVKHVAAELPGPEGQRVWHGGGPDRLCPLGRPEVRGVDGRTAQLASL